MENLPELEIGASAPDFTLTDLQDKTHTLADYKGRIVILNFWSADCPWSKRADEVILDKLGEWGEAVLYLPIASNENESRESITKEAESRNLPHLLLDVDHQMADRYGATTTPHVFVIDEVGILCYRGALDDVTFRQRTPSTNFLDMAVEAIRSGTGPEPAITDAYGCTIVRETH